LSATTSHLHHAGARSPSCRPANEEQSENRHSRHQSPCQRERRESAESDNQAGEPSFYYVEQETGNPILPFKQSDLGENLIVVSIQEAGYSWLPASFSVFGIGTRDATSPVTIVPLVHIPVWTDESDPVAGTDLGPLVGPAGTVNLPVLLAN
jgi:hypothetical protein